MKRNTIPCCAKCGTNIFRIYRPYGMFYREEDNRCNDCLTERKDAEWYVPCLYDTDGSIFGYSYASQESCERFYTTPDKNENKPVWRRADHEKRISEGWYKSPSFFGDESV